jgi:hypothetical protein
MAVVVSVSSSAGDLSAQATSALNLGPTTTKRVSFYQNDVLIGTLEVPAGVVFGLSDETAAMLTGRTESPRLELKGQNEVLIGARRLVPGVSIRTGHSIVLAIESQ